MTPETLKTASDFKRFFEGIPAKKWCVKDIIDSKGRHCAIGHVDRIPAGFVRLSNIFSKHGIYLISAVNNGDDHRFKQRGPRARILAALDLIISKEQSKESKG